MGKERDATQDRVTIQEAARRLGVKEDAIRKRIQRSSIRHEKAEDGRVYVWVDATQDTSRDTERTTQDAYQDTAHDTRLDDFREQITYLRQQLDEEREARRRADTIIAQLARANEEQARTIRELEASSETTGSPETVAGGAGEGRAPPRCPKRSRGPTAPAGAKTVGGRGARCWHPTGVDERRRGPPPPRGPRLSGGRTATLVAQDVWRVRC
jgi:hypothetical protein